MTLPRSCEALLLRESSRSCSCANRCDLAASLLRESLCTCRPTIRTDGVSPAGPGPPARWRAGPPPLPGLGGGSGARRAVAAWGIAFRFRAGLSAPLQTPPMAGGGLRLLRGIGGDCVEMDERIRGLRVCWIKPRRANYAAARLARWISSSKTAPAAVAAGQGQPSVAAPYECTRFCKLAWF